MKAPSGQGISSTFQFLKVSTMPMYWIKNRSLRRPFWRLPPAMGQACLVWLQGWIQWKLHQSARAKKDAKAWEGGNDARIYLWGLNAKAVCDCFDFCGHTLGTQTQHKIFLSCVSSWTYTWLVVVLYTTGMRICLQARARKDGAEDEVC